jgi:hypothetical protein
MEMFEGYVNHMVDGEVREGCIMWVDGGSIL